MDDAGAVEEHVHVSDFLGDLLDRGLVRYIELAGTDAFLAVELADRLRVHVRRPDLRTFAHECERGRAAHALAGSGNECGFSCEAPCHEGGDYTSRLHE